MYRNQEMPTHALESCRKIDPEDDDCLSKAFVAGEDRIHQRRGGTPSGALDSSCTVAGLRRRGKLSACWAKLKVYWMVGYSKDLCGGLYEAGGA